MADDNDIFYRIIHQTPDKQIRLTVNEFRGVEYLHLREYYLDFNEEWLPSNKGVAMPLDMNNSRELFAGLVEILSLAESKQVIKEHFKELLEVTYPDEELSSIRE
jgi:hypothetical protein